MALVLARRLVGGEMLVSDLAESRSPGAGLLAAALVCERIFLVDDDALASTSPEKDTPTCAKR